MRIVVGHTFDGAINVMTDKGAKRMTKSQEIVLKKSKFIKVFSAGPAVSQLQRGGPDIHCLNVDVHHTVDRLGMRDQHASENGTGPKEALGFPHQILAVDISFLKQQILPNKYFLSHDVKFIGPGVRDAVKDGIGEIKYIGAIDVNFSDAEWFLAGLAGLCVARQHNSRKETQHQDESENPFFRGRCGGTRGGVRCWVAVLQSVAILLLHKGLSCFSAIR